MAIEKHPGMRIAIVLRNLSRGGVTPTSLAVAEGLRDLGHEVSVLLCNPNSGYLGKIPRGIAYFYLEKERPGAPGSRPGSWLGRTRSAGLRFVRVSDPESLCQPASGHRSGRFLKAPAIRSLRAIRALAIYIREQRPQCLLPSLPGPKTAALVAKLLSREAPAVICHVHRPPIQRMLHHFRYRLLFKYVDHVITVSGGVADEVRTRIKVPASKITAIHNPLPLEKIRSAMQETPDHPWLRGDRELPLLLSVGRLSQEKDFRTLLQSVRLASEKHKLRLVILGDGPMKESLLNLRRTLGLEEIVSLPGWSDNPYAFMARADLFVLCSQWEGFGNVLVEALACGTPVVSTDCPYGPREILEGGRFGALTPPGDPSALAQAVLQALENPPGEQERDALRARAAQFSVERCAQAYERVIARCTS